MDQKLVQGLGVVFLIVDLGSQRIEVGADLLVEPRSPKLQQALARLGQFDDYIDTLIANLRLGIELGYSSPAVTVAPVPAQVRALIADDMLEEAMAYLEEFAADHDNPRWPQVLMELALKLRRHGHTEQAEVVARRLKRGGLKARS